MEHTDRPDATWQCNSCLASNPDTSHECDGCGAARPEAAGQIAATDGDDSGMMDGDPGSWEEDHVDADDGDDSGMMDGDPGSPVAWSKAPLGLDIAADVDLSTGSKRKPFAVHKNVWIAVGVAVAAATGVAVLAATGGGESGDTRADAGQNEASGGESGLPTVIDEPFIFVPALQEGADVPALPEINISLDTNGMVRFDVGAVDFGDSNQRSLGFTLDAPDQLGGAFLDCPLVADFRGADDAPADGITCHLFNSGVSNVGRVVVPGTFTTNREEYREAFMSLQLVRQGRLSDRWSFGSGGPKVSDWARGFALGEDALFVVVDLEVTDPTGFAELVNAAPDAAGAPIDPPAAGSKQVLALPVRDLGFGYSGAASDGAGGVAVKADQATLEGISSLVEDIDPVVGLS